MISYHAGKLLVSLSANTATAGFRPMGELNTTPLIDVLLVLLVMFIVTLPVTTHSLSVNVAEGSQIRPNPVLNTVTISKQDRLAWNGIGVTEAQLSQLAAASTRLRPEPELRFAPDADASYNQSVRVIRLIREAGVTNFGFVGNERFRQFSAD